MSTSGGISGGGGDKGEVHTENPKPIDLAHVHGHALHGHHAHIVRTGPPLPGGASVVQLRPIRSFTTGPTGALLGNKSGSVVGVAGQPSIFVNRSGPNLTILPARGVGGPIGVGSIGIGPVTSGPNSSISTLQFTRGTILSNVRPGNAGQGPSASITVTPISASSFGTNIRLSAGTAVNNGSWIQTTGAAQGTFSAVRPTTIQVTTRALRPEAKVIHIPQPGGVQQLTNFTQVQVLDTKGSILKPTLSTTPISVRGSIHHSTSSGGIALPISPFTIRPATIQRPQTSNAVSISSGSQKVITQPAHGPPIIVNPNQNSKIKLPPHTIQTITSMPRLPVFTLSANGKATALSNSPLMAVAPRLGGPSLIVNPGVSSGSPLTKVYPISRDVSSSIVETFINQGHVQTSQHQISSPTLTVSRSVGVSNNSNVFVTSQGSRILHPGTVIASTSGTVHSINSAIHTHTYGGAKTLTAAPQQHHQLVHVHGPISVNSTGNLNIPVQTIHGTQPPSFYIDQKCSISMSPTVGSVTTGQLRPIALDKRTINITSSAGEMKGSLVTGSMILTANPTQQYSQSSSTLHGPVTIPIGAHTFAHPIPMAHQQSLSGGQRLHQHIITSSQSQGITISKSTSLQSNSPMLHGGIHTYSTQGQPITIGGHHITVTPHSVPTQVISSQSLSSPSVTMSASTTTTSLSSIITTSGTTGPTTNIVTVSVNNATGSSTASITSTALPSSTPSSTVITSSCNNLTTTTPAQSPSQSSKATLSPRPSILRKRDAAGMGIGVSVGSSGGVGMPGGNGTDTYPAPLRAQRNLAINFTGNNSTNSFSGIPTIGVSINNTIINSGTPSVTISTVSAAAVANKENNATVSTGAPMSSIGIGSALITPLLGIPGGASISILKKEFQPPNEESSWQSCSSNSSSGSTTLSATSETAEIQLQQGSNEVGNIGSLQLKNNISNFPPSLPNMSIHNSSSSTATTLSGVVIGRGRGQGQSNINHPRSTGPPMITINPTHNGILHVVRSHPTNNSLNAGPIRHRVTSVSKAKDVERIKGRTKDFVSPRKKPRKQQLTTSDFIESSSPEISFYQGKRFKRSEPPVDPAASAGKSDTKPSEGTPLPEPEPEPQNVQYHIIKPHGSLLASNKVMLPKVRTNHFVRYDDVRSKDEKRPTINDLANQKNVHQKVSGWKLRHLSQQLDEVADSEMHVVEKFNLALSKMDERMRLSPANNRDLNRIEDLLKGNIQRCKVIRDQITESKSQVEKILDHQPRIIDVINKYISKRPIKKRERL